MALSTSVMSCSKEKETHLSNTICTTSDADCDEQTEQNYEWVLKPMIEAEDIIVFDTSYVPIHGTPKLIRSGETGENYVETLSHSEFAIIKRNEMYGFIGYDGSVLVEPQYSNYGSHNCGEVFLQSDSEMCYLGKDRKPLYGGCMCGDGMFNIEYDSDSNTITPEYWKNKLKNIEVAVPVAKKAEHSEHWGESINNYGIYWQGRLITGFDYDNYQCCIINDPYVEPEERINSSYSFAMCKDNKWYLFDKEGKRILEDECDVIHSNKYYSGSQEKSIFLFTEGICAVSQNGQMRYIDLEGNDVIPAGEFDEVRPVYNKMSWVKKDGKWGVIKIAAAVQDKIAKYKEEGVDVNKIEEEYIELLQQYKNKYPEYNSIYSWCRYYLYDFENDGIPEILIESGSCQGDRKIDVYAMKEKNVKLLGTFSSEHMELGSADDFAYQGLPANEYDYHDLYGYVVLQGKSKIYNIDIVDDSISCELDCDMEGEANYKEMKYYSYEDTFPISEIKNLVSN